MSVYLFVSHLCSIYFYRTVQHVSGSDIWKAPFYLNLARDVLFCKPARDVIRYTLFKVTSIDELGARTSSCNDSETISTQMAEIIIYY